MCVIQHEIFRYNCVAAIPSLCIFTGARLSKNAAHFLFALKQGGHKMKFCSKCGKPIEENSTFCSNCGAAVGQPDEPMADTSKSSGGKKFSLRNLDVFSADEPLKPKILIFLVLIALVGWGGLGFAIESIFSISLPAPVAMIFFIPLITSIIVQGILTFILCWNYLKYRIVFLVPALFISLFGCCLYFIIIPIVTIKHIITFLTRKKRT